MLDSVAPIGEACEGGLASLAFDIIDICTVFQINNSKCYEY